MQHNYCSPKKARVALPWLLAWFLFTGYSLLAQPTLVKDIVAGTNGANPTSLTNVNGTLYFVANGTEIWKSDGTAAGTVLVKSVSNPDNLMNVNGTLYFTGDGFIWKSDGTAAGTVQVEALPSDYFPFFYLTIFNGTPYFIAGSNGAEWYLFKIVGGEPVLVKRIIEGTYYSSMVYFLENINGTLYFVASVSSLDSDFTLWQSDGTEAGTKVVGDLSGGDRTSSLDSHAFVGNTLYYSISNRYLDTELFKLDLNGGGNTFVKDIYPGYDQVSGRYNSSYPNQLTNVNGTLYFTAADSTSGRELWKSDGTAAGTVLVKDLNPGPADATLAELTNVNGTLYFTYADATTGRELWKSDGTAAGTVLVADLNPGTAGSDPTELTNVNGVLYFAATDGTTGRELWKYDPPAPVLTTLRVKAAGAGAVTTVDGRVFAADTYFSGGRTSSSVSGDVAFTDDDALFASHRFGAAFSYNLPVSNGSYEVRLLFSETYFGKQVAGGVGSRKFNVDIEGSRKLTDYDAFAKGGGAMRAVQEVFKVVVTDGTLNIDFSKGTADLAFVSAIEVVPASKAWRINAGGLTFYTSSGLFQADDYASGGRASSLVSGNVANTFSDYLYQSHRFGAAFSYNLPTGNGNYSVTLHFNETYFGRQVGGGVGLRRFNVDIEGSRKLTEYDVSARAGGAMRAVQETFQVTVSDGTLNINFSQGSANLAFVSGIEVVPVATARLAAEESVKETEKAWVVRAYPMPAGEQLSVRLSIPAKQVQATAITSLSGKGYEQNRHRVVGERELEVNVATLPSGFYLLRLQSGKTSQVIKFIKR